MFNNESSHMTKMIITKYVILKILKYTANIMIYLLFGLNKLNAEYILYGR